jgi:cytoplasmic iron level regulating protein YaaA (DUF328/UPF0246 family)
MDTITSLIAKELELKERLKDIKREIVDQIEETDMYRGIVNLYADVNDVNPKTAHSHAVKVVYEHHKNQLTKE